MEVHPEGGEALTLPDGVHGVEERGLGTVESPGLRGGCGEQEGENYEKNDENLPFRRY
jgi:hypothetical protein